MMSKKFPFSTNRERYPEGSLIIKEYSSSKDENNYSVIEYDTETILKVLNNQDATEDFSEFTKMTKLQLEKLLYVATKNIVGIVLT